MAIAPPKGPFMRAIPDVGLLIQSRHAYYDEVLRGIAEYVAGHGPWNVFSIGGFIGDAPAVAVSMAGILCAVGDDAETARRLKASGLPVVDFSNGEPLSGFPVVRPDDQCVGRMVAEHFVQRGFRNFAFRGMPFRFSDDRLRGFRQLIEAAGFPCHVFSCGERWWDMERQAQRTEQWLATLPKPVALMVMDDGAALHLLRVCQTAGVPVPEQVAIAAVNNSRWCELAWPSLTSVPLDGRRAGFEAAGLLAGLMRGCAPPAEPMLIAPLPLVPRVSSDAFIMENADVANAMRFIAARASEPITVEDVLDELLISRRSLERAFREVLGRTPKEEIRRVHLDKAKTLLAETLLTMPQVARLSGFSSGVTFGVAFQREIGTTPAAYRRQRQEELQKPIARAEAREVARAGT